MEIIFDKSFGKSLDRLNDAQIKSKIIQVILEIEAAKSFAEIANVKKMQGFKTFYRIRIGNYRLGVELEDTATLRIVVALHRKDILQKISIILGIRNYGLTLYVKAAVPMFCQSCN